MKRFLGGLALLLVLCGCSEQTTESAPTLPIQPAPDAPELYDPEHGIEAITGGAWRAYDLSGTGCRDLAAMGEHLLLFEKDALTLLTGEDLTVVTKVDIPGLPLPGSGMIQIHTDGLGYFDQNTGAVVFLDSGLRRTWQLQLTDTVTGGAYLTPDWRHLYYCTTEGIRELSLQTGVSRLLRGQTAVSQSITGGFLNGNVLRCEMELADGSQRIMLISGESGQMLSDRKNLNALVGDGSFYYWASDSEKIFGLNQEQPHSFRPLEDGILSILPECGSALVAGATALDYYELTSGKRVASIRLEGFSDVKCLTATKKYLWLSQGETLYRWTLSKSAITEDTVYTKPHYTPESPDAAGLAEMNARAQKLEQLYGVEILLWKEPEALAPWDYSFSLEHRPEVIAEGLNALEKAMSQFPTDFFQRAAAWTDSGVLKILLVSGIYGGAEQDYFLPAPGLEYYQDGTAHIVLSLVDGLEQTFYHEVGHLIEAPILSTGTAYDGWNQLNPWGFSYTNDYIKNQDRSDEQYLQHGHRYFIDMHSMSFAVEDRSRIFEYACMPGNENYFSSTIMQTKLRRVCSGIRETFGLEEESYPWEQYLKS